MKRIIDFVTKNPVLITALVCVVFYFLPFKPKPFGDGEYHEGTLQLIQYIADGFRGTVRIDKGLFTLFYYLIPYSLAYVFHDDGLFYLFGIVFNCMATCWAVYYLFASFDLMNFSDTSKFWSIVVLILFPIHVYYAMGILAESAAFFGVSLFVYVWLKITANTNSVKYYLLLSFSLVIVSGTRPNLLPFLVLFSLYFLTIQSEWKNKIIFISSLAFMMVTLALVEKKINNTDGAFKKDIFRKHLLWSRYELRDDPFNWLPQHGQDGFESSDYLNNLKKRNELDSICEEKHLDKTSYYIHWVMNDIVHHPVLTLRQYSLKFFQSQTFVISPLMKSNKSNLVKWGIHIYINSINYILVFFSMATIVILWRQKKYQIVIPLLLLWSWSLLYVFVFHSEQRYMFPMRPVMLFLFAYFVNYYFNGNSTNKEVVN
ncbi:hypothetical protein SAMN05443549_103214 [Flavobacterium fluvii]|uniref:Dolichyl-phosphate-mannose-protein mannosyltransferase n=1 Tax=Flavobacterium fluvii TaxID=468056 RepID=A0A1M5IRW1_9FLAO|nr:hypothetical protein [Flavobacterium fluvii]SHG31057.1 hypothetical protein SAMN05443549_103214 [Flavobacterium fluvii]